MIFISMNVALGLDRSNQSCIINEMRLFRGYDTQHLSVTDCKIEKRE